MTKLKALPKLPKIAGDWHIAVIDMWDRMQAFVPHFNYRELDSSVWLQYALLLNQQYRLMEAADDPNVMPIDVSRLAARHTEVAKQALIYAESLGLTPKGRQILKWDELGSGEIAVPDYANLTPEIIEELNEISKRLADQDDQSE